MPLSGAERQARRRAKQAQERDGFKATIDQLLEEIDRLRQERSTDGRESRELRAKIATLEADKSWRLYATRERRRNPKRGARPRREWTEARSPRSSEPCIRTVVGRERRPNWTMPARRSMVGGIAPPWTLLRLCEKGKQRTKFKVRVPNGCQTATFVPVLVLPSL
jgi:hypothetical protein